MMWMYRTVRLQNLALVSIIDIPYNDVLLPARSADVAQIVYISSVVYVSFGTTTLIPMRQPRENDPATPPMTFPFFGLQEKC